MPTPSLLIVPARFKTGKLYSQIPTSGAGDFTVTRNTEARRFDSAGLVASVASGIPRLDYYTSGGVTGCPALLVEPSAQNLCLQSAAIQTSPWSGLIAGTGVAPTITANNAVAPDGTTTATKILLDRGAGTTVSDASIWNQSITVTAVAHTFSVWLKSATGGNQVVQLRANSAPLTTITITTDWQRFTVVNTPTAGSRQYGFDLRGNTAGAGQTAEFYAWGAQLETGSIATSYIPTTTGSVTRAADVITVSGAVSGSIGQTEGTLYAEIVNTLVASYAEAYVYRVFADANNEIWARKEGGTNTYSFRWRANSQNTTFLNVAVPNGVNKIAFGYKSGDTALFLNGSQVATTNTDVRAFSINPTTIALGSTSSGQFFNDRIRAAALYTTRLTNAELQSLTTL